MNRFDQRKTLIFVAVEIELPLDFVDRWHVHRTSVGKVNAAEDLYWSTQSCSWWKNKQFSGREIYESFIWKFFRQNTFHLFLFVLLLNP